MTWRIAIFPAMILGGFLLLVGALTVVPPMWLGKSILNVMRRIRKTAIPLAVFALAALAVLAALPMNPVLAVESAALTGTLSDGGTVAEMVAGGETIILTLTDTTWTTDGTDAGLFVAADTEYLSVADNASLTHSTDMSIAAWVTLTTKTSGQVSRKGSGSDFEFALRYIDTSDRFEFSLKSTSETETVVAETFGAPTIGDWVFLVASFDDSTNKLGISVNNGTFDNLAGFINGGRQSTSLALGIGAAGDGASPFDGGIAAVGYWEKVLTPAERTSLFNTGAGLYHSELTGSLLTNLVSYWDLDEQSGTRFDSEGTNDLTDNNTVLFVVSPLGPDGFLGQRQALINGMVSDQDDANGWNVRRADFPITDIVRTSDTVATMTLTASPTFTIPVPETVTVTLPAAILAVSSAITASPSFTITPAFVSSGNRVSTAIDLSGVTDVAFCSLAWEANVPANTTLTVDTSIDGGVTFALGHTNGNCPSGVSLGASLATITDFRIRVNLATTDSAVTPLVNTLALVIEDTAGQDLYYQLNTTPGVTLTDRSTNNFVGTMSFSVGSSTINADTDAIETTRTARDPLATPVAHGIPEVVSQVTGDATAENLFNQDELGFAALPGQSLVEAMAGASDGLPIRFVWFIFIGFFIVGAGVIAMRLTGMLVIAIIVMGIGLGIWVMVGDGIIPGWIIFAYLPVAAAFVLVRKGLAI